MTVKKINLYSLEDQNCLPLWLCEDAYSIENWGSSCFLLLSVTHVFQAWEQMVHHLTQNSLM